MTGALTNAGKFVPSPCRPCTSAARPPNTWSHSELRFAKGRKSGSACDEPLLDDLKYVSVSIPFQIAGYVTDSKNDPQ